MLFPRGCPSLLWRVGPSREDPISRALQHLIGVGSGQRDSVLAASEACPLAEQDTLVPPGYTWSLWFPHSSDPTQASPSSIQAVPFLNFPQGLGHSSSRFPRWGLVDPEHSAVWPSICSQEPMLPSVARHCDRDNRLSSCACGFCALRKVTDGHQDT